MTGKSTKRMKRTSTHRHHASTKSHSKRAVHAVPPPTEEREPDPPRMTPGQPPPEGELVTEYPDRSDWEADVSEAAMARIRSGEHIKRNRGPNTEAS